MSVPIADPLFVYGSLTFREVQEALLGRVPDARPAAVAGWRNAALRARPFPGLVAGAGRVPGSLLTGLDADERALLDAYEGPMYEGRTVPLEGGGQAWTYVCVDHGLVLDEDWDRERFGTELLASYTAGCVRWLNSRARHVS
ncbi:gamma-glutamylcyclotransferase [Streptomyces sp. NBC_00726]|uniref:gamma-glutamylcyclotransferase family protein n=1 Tax=Streptomyces sp. NBC_00726 TaxID=2903674 RepID=UPI0038635B2C